MCGFSLVCLSVFVCVCFVFVFVCSCACVCVCMFVCLFDRLFVYFPLFDCLFVC